MFMAIFSPAPQISVKSQHLSRLNYKVFLFFIIPSFFWHMKNPAVVCFSQPPENIRNIKIVLLCNNCQILDSYLTCLHNSFE